MPIAQDELVLRLSAQAQPDSGSPAPPYQNLTALRFPVTFAYGATTRLKIVAQPTLDSNRLEQSSPDGSVSTTSSGFGDTLMFMRYTLLQKDWIAKTFRLAPLAGVYFPTGNASQSQPLPLRRGSGSFDPYAGLAGSYQSLDYAVFADTTYRYNPVGTGGFKRGDELHADFSFQGRVWPFTVEEDSTHFLWAVLEMNLIRDGRNYTASGVQSKSGGNVVYLDPGFRYSTPFWEFGGVVQIPIADNRLGRQLGHGPGLYFFFSTYFEMPAVFGR